MVHAPRDDDRQWDEVLRRVGPHLDLPTEPDEARRRRWKRGWLRRHRLFTLWTGSGAMAAGILLSVLLIMPRTVDADVIFANLRAALSQGMRLTFEGVEIDLAKMRPDLRGTLRCAGSVLAAEQEHRKAFADVDIELQAETDDTRIPPMRLKLLTAAVPKAEWAYLRMDDPGDIDDGVDPRIGVLADALRRGVYFDLVGLTGSRAGRRMAALPAFGLGAVFRLRDRDGLDVLFSLIRHHAESIEVLEPARPGEDYVLLASGFSLDVTEGRDKPGRRAVASLLENMTLRVFFNQKQGVRRLEIERFGHGEGRVVLNLEHEPREDIDTLVSLERHETESPGLHVDMRSVRRLHKATRKLVEN